MNQSKIYISMFGQISISWNGHSITESDSRSRKTWLLLAYLIHERRNHITQEEIIQLLWDEDDPQANPQGSLKTALHRLRSLLNRLSPDAGHQLVLRQKNSYAWNTDFELEYDAEIFDSLYHDFTAASDEDLQLASCLRIFRLYQGDFLPSLYHEPWAVQIAEKYHTQYLQAVKAAVSILHKRGQVKDILEICRQALKIEPLDEELFEYYLQALLTSGQHEEAAAAYEDLNRRFLSQFGTMPSEKLRSLYWQALRTDNGYSVPVDEICCQLKESQTPAGALFCEYDFFKVLYQAQARAIARTGEEYHIALLSLKNRPGKNLSQNSLDLAMRNLQQVICRSVRHGDVATRCSASQFILMLPRANYESSCMVSDRIVRAFCRQYPHSPAEITVHVFPVEPAK